MTPSLAINKLALLISAVSSPFIIIPLFALWIIGYHSSSPADFALWAVTFLLCAPLPPLLYVLRGVRTGHLSDIHVMMREQRQEPFLVALLGSLLLAVVYAVEGVPRALLALALVLCANGVVFLILTQRYKVSIHAAAYAASVLIVGYLISAHLFVLYVLLPLIIWARLRRKRHDPLQSVTAIAAVLPVTWLVLWAAGV